MSILNRFSLSRLLGKIKRYRIKRRTYSLGFSSIGKDVILQEGAIVAIPSMIEIGSNVNIGPNAVLFAIYKKIKIGNNVLVAPHCTMVSGDHGIHKIGVPIINNHLKEPNEDAEIIIDDDVWIGANVTILKGVTIGRGCVVAAGAVVVKSAPPYSIIGGVPAKIIGERFSIEEIIKHEESLYPIEKRYSENEIKNIKTI